MSGPLASASGRPSASMLSAIRDRLAGFGWQHRRDPLMGREEWMEPLLPSGQREPRSVLVDGLFRGASGWVVEGCNGHERLVLRCVADTDPQIVLVTLDLWRILPGQATTPGPVRAVTVGG